MSEEQPMQSIAASLEIYNNIHNGCLYYATECQRKRNAGNLLDSGFYTKYIKS